MPEEQKIMPSSPAKHNFLMLPLKQTKTIHWIRHGQGYHNVAGEKDRHLYASELYFDSHLTEEGWRQAEDLHAHIQASGIKVDLVVASSLTRALETAVGAFSVPQPLNSPSSPLMAAQSGEEGKRVQRVAMSASPDDGVPPFLVSELCREHLGVNPCDRRRSLSELKNRFPAADWSQIKEEEDKLWLPDHRETASELQERAKEFLALVMARPEKNIAVVTHSEFLLYMFQVFGEELGHSVKEDLRRWYRNCELRSIVLADVLNLVTSDPHHHKGGAPSNQ
jgi:broad specificity phosphatase PhoE